ncbi:MAG TPA: hypothetical protein EYO33_18275 [Phycisphaerales bacterium]|nr:hypothetical protein [Phycisphaerales bacterium]
MEQEVDFLGEGEQVREVNHLALDNNQRLVGKRKQATPIELRVSLRPVNPVRPGKVVKVSPPQSPYLKQTKE